MKRVTASEARRNWFRLLDEVLDGEVVVIERKGRRIVVRREPTRRADTQPHRDYSSILRAPAVEHADTWTWEWPGPETELRLREEPGS